MPDKSKGHQQRLDREARLSAVIGVVCALIFMGCAHYLFPYGQSLYWLVGVGFLVGMFASFATIYFIYESVACVKAGVLAYTAACAAGAVVFLVAR